MIMEMNSYLYVCAGSIWFVALVFGLLEKWQLNVRLVSGHPVCALPQTALCNTQWWGGLMLVLCSVAGAWGRVVTTETKGRRHV